MLYRGEGHGGAAWVQSSWRPTALQKSCSCGALRLDVEFTAEQMEIVGKARIVARRDRRMLGDVDRMYGLHFGRPMAQHDHALRQRHRLVDVVRDEDHGLVEG